MTFGRDICSVKLSIAFQFTYYLLLDIPIESPPEIRKCVVSPLLHELL